MSKWSVTALLVCAAVLGCSQDPPQWNALSHDRSRSSVSRPAATVATTDELVVYLDASKSIQGYVQAGSKSVYAVSLRELRNVASLLDRPLQTWVRNVDASVGGRVNDVELNRASIDPTIYQGSETNLARAIAQFGEPTVIDASVADKKVPRVPLIHVLVTDGVQSTDHPANEADCDSGSDQICVRAQLSRWLRAGWSGSIIGIRSQFKGIIYSEINHNVPKRYKIAYTSDPADATTMRPFYLYVFSPNPAALTEFIAKFKRRLRTTTPGVVMRELPLNVPFATGSASARVLTSPTGDIISIEGGHQSETDRITVRFDAHDARDNAGSSIMVRIRVPWSANAADMGTPRELGQLVSWNVVRVGAKGDEARGRIPLIRVGEASVGNDGSIQLAITPVWPAGTGDRSWAVYALRGVVRLEEDTPSWIREWSTDLDNTPEYGNRTLFLENGALGIWRSRSRAPEDVAEILIRIGP
jgi:hypothetical protein